MKTTNKWVGALLIGGFATILSFFFASAINSTLFRFIPPHQILVHTIKIIENFAAMFLAVLIYYKLILKSELKMGIMLLYSTIAAIVERVLFSVLPFSSFSVMLYVLPFVVFSGVALLVTGKLMPVEGIEQTGKSGNTFSSSSATDVEQGGPFASMESPVLQPANDMGDLRKAILNAVKPSLKAPLTAVLCENEQMTITQENGVYLIRGAVSSQNTFGAMVSADFKIKATYTNGKWCILKARVGDKQRMHFVRNFIIGFIISSIIFGILFGIYAYQVWW